MDDDFIVPPIGGDYTDYNKHPDDLGAEGPEEEDLVDRYEVFMPAVQSLVNAIGGYEEVETIRGSGKLETIYRPGDSVLAVLKDLKKLWRKDDTDDERTVARCMAKAGLMKELVALLVECSDRGDWGRKVALVACDLIAALTWPIDVAQELKELQDEPGVVTDYASLLRNQVEYKALILKTSGPLRCLLALMLPSLAKARKEEKDQRIISLGLHIVRNLLATRDAVADGTSAGDKEEMAHLQSTLIIQLDKLTFLQLVLTLASCADKTDFNQFNVLVLDILYLIFRSTKPKDLGQDQDRAPIENLSKLLELERRQKSLHTKSGSTRHSRFGTTVAVITGGQKIVLHKQSAIKVNPGQILDEVKRKRAGKVKKVDELSVHADLSPEAIRVLQQLGKTFISSCFNLFFASILKDIRMERSKIRPTDNVRTFYLARFFLEYLLILRQKHATASEKKGSEKIDYPPELSLSLVEEMAEMESVRWVVMRMRITMDDRPPAWTELQACLDCFTQILLLIDAMAMSDEEEDVDVAEILQNQLYYNGDILDSSLSVISQYKDQSIAYLDSVIHFAYVLLRMLEKYSKNKSFMFIRKKKAARNKRKKVDAAPEINGLPEEYGGEEEGGNEPDRDAPSYAEHAFTFTSFEKRFAQEQVVNTLLTYLARFKDFDDPDQMKRVVGLMHRQVIKTQAEGLYFRVSCLNLFRKILDQQQALPKGGASKDLIHLLTYILRKFFKKVAEDPFLIVEALGPKSRGRWKELSSYKSDDESDDGMGGQKARIREKLAKGPVELEFKKNKKLSWSQQMGVAVSLLVTAGHEDWIRWIIRTMEVALAARTEVVLAIDGQKNANRGEDSDDDEDERVRDFSGPSKEALEKFVRHDLDPETEELRTATIKDSQLRLMLKLLSFDLTTEEKAEDQKWFIPSSVPPSSLTSSIGALNQFLETPIDINGQDPKTLIRKARPPRPPRPTDPSSDESSASDSDGIDGNVGTAAGGNKKHLKKALKARRKALKKATETQIYKSAAFIVDSDDDEEADRAFFEREAALRRENEELAEKSGNIMLSAGTRKRKRGKGTEKTKKSGTVAGVGGEDEDGMIVQTQFSETMGMDVDMDESQVSGIHSESEDSVGEDEGEIADEDGTEPTGPPARSSPADGGDSVDESEDDAPARTKPKPSGRSRKVIDPDDEDD